MIIINKIYCDADGVILNSIAAICSLYNDDFKYYKDFTPVKWWEINTWDFEECKCANREYIDMYFTQPRFFRTVTYMDWAKEVLTELSKEFEIVIVSAGKKPNLKAKEEFFKEELPFCTFLGVDMDVYVDKSHIDMSDGIFLDDVSTNLKTSNAMIKICFGDEYVWNEDWSGIRKKNWNDVRDFIRELKGDGE